MTQSRYSDTTSFPNPKAGVSQLDREDAQRRRDAHTNSATSGDDSDDGEDVPYGNTKNPETEPDRAGK